MADDAELLFFDTFSHETAELNLDLVQFPRPVYVSEIRVIPLGSRVAADFPGGHRLGATNPSSFKLEFFLNDLQKRGACTFDRAGSFDYKQNVDIQFFVTHKVLTDGLVIRGWYSVVTLAVYGTVAKIQVKDRGCSPPPSQTSRQTSSAPALTAQPQVVEPHPVPCTKDNAPQEPARESNWDCGAKAPPLENSPPPPPPFPPVHSEPPRFSEPPPPVPIPEPHPPYTKHPPVQYQDQTQYSERPPYKFEMEHYPKTWQPPEEPFVKKPPDVYKRQPYDGPHHYHGNRVWEKPHDTRESESFRAAPHREDHRDREKDREYESRKRRDHRDKDPPWEHADSRYHRDWLRDRDRDRRGRSPEPPHERPVRVELDKRPPSPKSPSKSPRPKSPPPPDFESKRRKTDEGATEPAQEASEDIFEPVTPDNSPPELYNLSDGEIQEAEHAGDEMLYEEILSEEEIMSDEDERSLDVGDVDYDLGDDSWNLASSFNPYQCEFAGLQHFIDPGLSSFEIVREKSSSRDPVILTEDSKTLVQCLHQFADKDHNEIWVEALENVSNLISTGLAEIQDKKLFETTTDTLLRWSKEGLNFDLAMAQTQAPYKLRHLKAGIKLTAVLLTTCTEVVEKMLDEGVAKWLLDLYGKPFMSRPIKLLILQAIDALTFTSQGILFLLEKKVPLEYPDTSVPAHKVSVYDPPVKIQITTGYQKLLDIFMSKESTRAIIGFSSLMQKLHLYEALLELHNTVDKISQSMIKDVLSSPPVLESDPEHSATSDVESEHTSATTARFTVSEAQMDTLIGCISEITSIYENAQQTLFPAARYLPATCQFEIPKSSQNPYPNILRLLRDCHFLQTILVLLSSPVTSSHPSVLSAIRDLFCALFNKNAGVQFLFTNLDALNAIPRALFQEENRDENNEEGLCHQLGLQLVSTLQAFQYIDALLAYHHKEGPKELDDTEVVSMLHQLYLMTFSPVGKLAVINILAMESNMEALIPLLEFTDSEETNSRLSKSVCCGYATELLLLTVHHNESVEFLQLFQDRLQALTQQESMPKLQELSSWLSPLKKVPNLSCETVGSLMTLLKAQLEGNPNCFAPELITTLRILRYQTLPPTGVNKDCQELKYKYALLQLVGNDGMEQFVKILQQVLELFYKPAQLSSALCGSQGAQLLSVMKPIVTMLHLMLSSVISGRGTEFKDLTVVPVLLKLYSLLSFFPISSYMHPTSQQVLNEVIEILLAYTQPFLEHLESEEALSKSLWTQMVKEILTYTISSPYTWMTGLAILSELLPLPLPLQTKEALSTGEVEKMLNCRKLWSAHLHSLNDQLKSIIITMAGTACQPLQQLLRRICVQLSDLAAPTAVLVARAALEALYESIGVSPGVPEESKEEKGVLEKVTAASATPAPAAAPPAATVEAAPEITPCTSNTARILNFFSFMVSHATFKVAFLHVLKGNVKTDDHYTDFLNKFLVLLGLPSNKSSHLHAQECLVSIFQSLCDPEIGLITFENGAAPLEVLSSSLPSPDLLKQLISALVQHVGEAQMSFSSILPCLRTLVMVTEHDLGFLCIKAGLEAHPRALHSLLSRLRTGFSKDSSDCLSTLSTVVELLRLMVQGYEEGQALFGRTFLLSSVHLLDAMAWEKKPEKGMRHPLAEIEERLMDCSQEDEVLESLLENVSGVIGVLNEGLTMKEDKGAKVLDYPDVTLPACEALPVQFSTRQIFLAGEVDEERLSPAYWLGLPCAEDPDPFTEQVTADLISVAEKYLPDFDLRATLEKICSADEKDKDTEKKVEASATKRKYTSLTSASTVEAPSKRPFIAPMRGRPQGPGGASGVGVGGVGAGFTRAAQHAQPRNDPFRSRPPNTSRPPSMHVDDFLAMEGSHTQAPASSQPLPKRIPKEVPRGRGRGGGFDISHSFGVARGSAGRFFTPPGSYSRREPGSPSRLQLVPSSLRSGLAVARPMSLGAGQVAGWPGRSSSNPSIIPHTNASLISPKINPTPSLQRTFGRGSHTDRLTSPRARDLYSLGIVGGSGGALSAGDRGGRFGHNSRGGSVGVLPSGLALPPTHWSDPRLKLQDTRFSTSVIPRGRRDLGNRHARSFTR